MNTIGAYNNNYRISNSGINVPIDQDRLKASLAESKQAVNENIESNTMTKLISGSAGDNASKLDALLLIPVINFADKAVDRFIGGPEEHSLLKKFANVGDRISHVLHLDNVFSEEKASNFGHFLKTNRFTKFFTDEFKAVSKSPFAQRTSSAQTYIKDLDAHAQEVLAALSKAAGDTNLGQIIQTTSSLSDDTVNLLKNIRPLKKELTADYLGSVMNSLKEGIPKLSQAGYSFSKSEIQNIQLLERAVNSYLANPDSISRGALSETIASVLSKFGNVAFNDRTLQFSDEALDTFASVAAKKKFSTKEILSALDDLSNNGMQVVDTGKLSQLRNKVKASTAKMGDTLLGKKFAQGALKTKDIVTYGGGIISLYFTATALSQAIKAAKEAPKGEKKSTFFHVISEQYLGFILFGPSIQMLYRAGGNKYRGMTAEARQALKNLIQNTNIDETITREGIKVAKLQRDLLLKGFKHTDVEQLAGKGIQEAKNLAKTFTKDSSNLKFWERPLKAIGRVLDMGLDKIQKPTFVKLPVLGKKIKLPKPTLKGFVGGLGRAVIIMMVIQPFIQKPITKLCHKIFGKPETYLKKQESANGAKTQDGQQVVEQPNQQAQQPNGQSQVQTPQVNPVVNPQVSPQVKPQSAVNNTETNLLKKWTQPAGSAESQPAASVSISNEPKPQIQQPQQEIPALNIFKKDKNKQERYIPSTDPIVIQDNEAQLQAQVNDILKHTEKVRKEAEKLLK